MGKCGNRVPAGLASLRSQLWHDAEKRGPACVTLAGRCEAKVVPLAPPPPLAPPKQRTPSHEAVPGEVEPEDARIGDYWIDDRVAMDHRFSEAMLKAFRRGRENAASAAAVWHGKKV